MPVIGRLSILMSKVSHVRVPVWGSLVVRRVSCIFEAGLRPFFFLMNKESHVCVPLWVSLVIWCLPCIFESRPSAVFVLSKVSHACVPVWGSLAICCLSYSLKAGLRPAFLLNEQGVWCLCTCLGLSCHVMLVVLFKVLCLYTCIIWFLILNML